MTHCGVTTPHACLLGSHTLGAPSAPSTDDEGYVDPARGVVAVLLHPTPDDVRDPFCPVKGYTKAGRYMTCSRVEGHEDPHWDAFDEAHWVVG